MKNKFTAVVVSDKQDKTITVARSESKIHPIYRKRYKATRKYQVHDEKNEATVGDMVEVEESRPISKNKSMTLVKIISKAEG